MSYQGVNFRDAMTLTLLAVLVFSYAIFWAIDSITVRANRWYSLHHCAGGAVQRPWYVRCYEFLNQ